MIDSCEQEYIILDAPVDVIFSDNETRQPDILMVHRSRESIVEEHGVVGPPDLVIEIPSPNSAKRDRMMKKESYARLSLMGNTYEVESGWEGGKVQLRYDPFDLSHGQVWQNGKRLPDAKPMETVRRLDRRIPQNDIEFVEEADGQLSFLDLAQQRREPHGEMRVFNSHRG